MAKPLVTEELWEVIEPLLPEELSKPKGGRPRIDDCAALTGILLVLKTGIPWEMLQKVSTTGMDSLSVPRTFLFLEKRRYFRFKGTALNALDKGKSFSRTRYNPVF